MKKKLAFFFSIYFYLWLKLTLEGVFTRAAKGDLDRSVAAFP